MGGKLDRYCLGDQHAHGQGKRPSTPDEENWEENWSSSSSSNDEDSDEESEASDEESEGGSSRYDEESDEVSDESTSSSSSEISDTDFSEYLDLDDLISHKSYRKPQIPIFLKKLCKEIESRGLRLPDLYLRGSTELYIVSRDKEFMKNNEIHERFGPKDWKPKEIEKLRISLVTEYDYELEYHDQDTLCLVLQESFKKLREPLIPREMTTKFIDIGKMDEKNDCMKQLCEAVEELPKANRDTLAFLILHLQLVEHNRVKKEEEIRADNITGRQWMITSNLSFVLASSIFRKMYVKEEEHLQNRFMAATIQKMFLLHPKYWKQFTRSGFFSQKKTWRPKHAAR